MRKNPSYKPHLRKESFKEEIILIIQKHFQKIEEEETFSTCYMNQTLC